MDRGGRFILKPNPPPFEEVPANEALTMTLAEIAGLEVPPHGLLSPAILDPILHTLAAAWDAWVRKIENSYLSASAKAGYLEILSERRGRLGG